MNINNNHDTNHPVAPNTATTREATATSTTVITTSLDQERQILLLMLLAQVCALHDVTPKTFTVHVLELYERGILDPSSIHFLYDLGLVTPHPMIGTNLNSNEEDNNNNNNNNTTTTTNNNNTNRQPDPLLPPELSMAESASSTYDSIHTAIAPTETLPQHPPLLLLSSAKDNHDGVTTTTTTAAADSGTMIPVVTIPPQQEYHHQQQDNLRLRSMETSAIRLSLQYQDQQHQQQQQSKANPGSKRFHHSKSSWSVDEHPLSLSRYQREFNEISRLASGSFGDVYCAINYMDGREYAIKRVSFNAVGYSNMAVQQVIREVHCLAVCDHPNVVRYYTSWLEPSWMTGNSTTSNRQLMNGTDNSDDDDDEYIKLITHLQSVMSSGNSIENLKENLHAYFHDSSLRHHRRRSSIGGSICDYADLDIFDRHDSHTKNDRKHWTLNDTRDDISIDGYCPRHSQRQRSKSAPKAYHPHTPYESSMPQNLHYSSPLYTYQISLYIQMQLCNSITLADWIRSRNEKHDDVSTCLEDRIDDVITIFEQIVHGLHHVHERNIVHRDLKPSNVFAAVENVDTTLHFKIGDFGLSKLIPMTSNRDPLFSSGSPTQLHRGRLQRQRQLLLLEAATPIDTVLTSPYVNVKSDLGSSSWFNHHTAGVGTASYAAPEQVVTQTYGTAVDIFSLGLILLELVCCFSTEHERLQTFHNCRQQRIVPCELQDKYPRLAQVVLNCTKPHPAQRPTAADLKAIHLREEEVVCVDDDAHSFVDVNKTNSESMVMSLRKLLIDKEQQIAELKLQLDQSRQDLIRKDRIIESLTQSNGNS